MSLQRASLATLFALTLAACGGGDDAPAAAAPSPTPATTVTPAALVISAASTASVNGTLNKAAGIGESGVSDATGNYSSAGPNDYCRVAVYEIPNSGDSKKYDMTVVFSKTTKAATYVQLAEHSAPAGFNARAAVFTTVTVDIANRSIGFSATALGAGGANTATLNGTLEYPSNTTAADRATCG